MIQIVFLFFCLGFSNLGMGQSSTYPVLKKYPSHAEPFLVEVLAENLGVVWAMVFINNSELLFTERQGAVKKIKYSKWRDTVCFWSA